MVALTGDDAGKISTAAGNNGSGAVDALMVSLGLPMGVAVGATGLVIADNSNNIVRQVSLSSGLAVPFIGIGTWGFGGDGGDPAQALTKEPRFVRHDSDGNLYLAERNRVRVVPAADGTLFGVAVTAGKIQTIAGGGEIALNEGGAALGNLLVAPGGMAFQGTGKDLIVADAGQHRIFKVERATGKLTTLAGTGVPGYGGDDATATAAQLNTPQGLAILADGSLVIADSMNHRIRSIGADGKIRTAAGGGTDVAYGENVPAISAQLNVPWDVVDDGAGGFYLTDKANHAVRQVSAAGTIFTVAGTAKTGGFAGDGGPSLAAKLQDPAGLARDAGGNLYFADSGNGRVRKLLKP